MIIAKAVEISSLALFAAVAMLQTLVEGIPQGPILQLGALGLVGFMVAQNYRQGGQLSKVLDRKDAEIRDAEARANIMAREFTEAVRYLTTTLAERPCVAAGEQSDERRARADGPPLNAPDAH